MMGSSTDSTITITTPPIATTQVYTRLDFQHLAKVYDAAHPRAKRK